MSILTDSHRTRPRGLAALLDQASASHSRALAFLLILSLLTFVPGIFRLPPIDREEARFAQATKQMMEAGDFIDIRFQDELRYSKPVGLYWLQAAAVKSAEIAGVPYAEVRIALYRLPSLAGAIGAVLLTYWAALAFLSRRGSLVAAAMLASSLLLGMMARLAMADALLLAAIVAAMGALARAYRWQVRGQAGRLHWTSPAIFWTALGLGVLLKGPVILFFVGLPILTLAILDRSLQFLYALRPWPGLVWFLLLVLPWPVAIAMRSGGFFFSDFRSHDIFGRLGEILNYSFLPPGFYLALFFLTFWPAALLAAPAAPSVWRARTAPPMRFLLAWLVPAWLVLELVWLKLPHFVLPLYPAIAIMIASVIESHHLSQNRWLIRGTFWWFALPALLMVASLVLLIRLEGNPGFLAWPLGAAAVIFGFRAWWLYDSENAERAILRACAAAIMLGVALYSVVIPSLRVLFPSVMVAQVMRNAGCPKPQVVIAGLAEPSFVFLLGTSTRMTDGAGAADFLRHGGCRLAAVDTRHERSFAMRAEALGLRYTRLARVDAFNLARGRPMTVAVYRSEEWPGENSEHRSMPD